MRMPTGYGSVIKLKGNRRKPYQVRITKGWTDEGKQIYAYLGYFAKKDEAYTALSEYNSSPYDITKNTTTFEMVYQLWSENHYKKVSQSAVENYTNAYNRYCKSLHKMRFKDLRISHLQNIINECGMAYPTRKVIKTLLNSLFKYAIQNDICEKNYAEFIELGQKESKLKRNPFTQEEIQKLFESVDKFEWVDTVLIMIYTSMRVGELLTIEIENVHLNDRYMIGGIKTEAGRNRVIPISKKIEPFIRKFYEKNKNNKYLIMNSLGNPMQYSNYRREKWDRLMIDLGLEGHKPHDCRHTRDKFVRFCTELIRGQLN